MDELFEVAISLTLVAALCFLVITRLGLLGTPRALLLTFSTAASLLAVEVVVLIQAASPSPESAIVRWTGDGIVPDPVLGMVYKSHAELRTYYPTNPRGYFTEESKFGIRDSASSYFVSYQMNSAGFRDRERASEAAPHIYRIACLGDSCTLGVGVRMEDTFTGCLERMLNGDSAAASDAVEVLNFGVSGYGTRQERLCYEQIASKYRPDVALVVMVYNDDVSWLEEVEQELAPGSESGPRWLRKLKSIKNRLRRRNFQVCVEEFLKLHVACQHDASARLAVVLFLYADPSDSEGDRMRQIASKGLEKAGIPLLDLSPYLPGRHSLKELYVHCDGHPDDALDSHPNEIAHRIAAEAIRDFLVREKLLERPSRLADTMRVPAVEDSLPRSIQSSRDGDNEN